MNHKPSPSPSPSRLPASDSGAHAQSPDFAALVEEHSRYLAGIATRILGNASDVDDVMQDVFMTAFRKLPELHKIDSLRFWLGRVTVNHSLSLLRRRRVQAVLGLHDGVDYEQAAAPGLSPERRMVLSRLYRALDKLPAANRAAWVLRHVEGESIADVARLCACSLSTAKRRISAAQSRLDKWLPGERVQRSTQGEPHGA